MDNNVPGMGEYSRKEGRVQYKGRGSTAKRKVKVLTMVGRVQHKDKECRQYTAPS